jgi:hypothetical protein
VLVVCLSFAVCLPGTTCWELNWPARAVATLVSAAVGVTTLPRTFPAAVAAQSAVRAASAVAVLVLAEASTGALRAPPRTPERLAWPRARAASTVTSFQTDASMQNRCSSGTRFRDGLE